MKTEPPKVAVVVAEPESGLCKRFVSLCQRIWPTHEVLPRSTHVEMHNATQHVHAEVMIVRTSVLQTSPSFSAGAMAWLTQGGKLVCIQDSGPLLKNKGWLNLGEVYYLSNLNGSAVLLDLLLSIRLQQIAAGQLSHSSY